MVARHYDWVEQIKLNANEGFARANNLALKSCRGRYVLFLNSDAFLHAGALVNLVSVLDRRPAAVLTGPRLLNPDGSLQRSAWPFPGSARLLIEALGLHRLLRRTGRYEDLGAWDHDDEREVDFVIGACLLARTRLVRKLSGFDERFWMYGEEADLQRRARDFGYRVVFTPAATCTHVGGASEMPSPERLRWFYSGQLRFLHKHGGPVATLWGRLALLAGALLRRDLTRVWLALSLRWH